MRPDSWRDVEIAGWSSAHPCLALPAQPNPLSRLGARRDIDSYRFWPQDPSGSTTRGAWISWQLASSLTARTGHAKLKGPLDYRLATGASTLGARRGSASRFGSSTVTGFALDTPLQCQRCLKTAHGVKEIDIHRRFDILASRRPGLCSTAAAKHAP